MKRDMPTVDLIGTKAVFSIKGNRYRLVADIDFERSRLFFKWFGPHAEYDRLNIEEL